MAAPGQPGAPHPGSPRPGATVPASGLRRRLQWAFGVCLAADLVLVGWLISPQAPSRSANLEQLAESKIQLAGLRAQSAQLRLLRTRVHDSQLQVEQLMAEGIPEEAEQSSKLLAEMNRIAGAADVQLSGAEFHADKNPHLGMRRLVISIQVAGSYGSVVKFINLTERSPMFFLIDQVSVSGGRAAASNSAPGGVSDPVKLEVQLEAFAQSNAPQTSMDAGAGGTP